MAAVTQRIANYLGGVSKQSDVKKLHGQVVECLNGYPDPTTGLIKRQGLNFKKVLASSGTYDNAKWVFIQRDDKEIYFGCIKSNQIYIWNASDGTVCTVTYGTGAQAYLTGAKSTDYDILTVQDTSIITNKTVTVATQAAPAYTTGKKATVILKTVEYSADYTVTLAGVNYTYATRNADSFSASGTDTKLHVDDILDSLETSITNAGYTVTRCSTSLEIEKSTAFNFSCRGGIAHEGLIGFQEQVDNVTELPAQSKHGRLVKIVNTNAAEDDYYAEFKADNNSSGIGFWEETRSPTASAGLDDTTCPHELVNTAANTFVFRKRTWTDRLVGDAVTNSDPTFVGAKIQQAFFYGNRLGFLTGDNVSMSQAGEYDNFYHVSALTTTAADPVDLSCSAIKPAVLHGVIPTTQGLVLFSRYQQFLMSASSGVFTPSGTAIKGIASYEVDTDMDPVEVGSKITFVSKTPGYTRIFSMVTRGQDENPIVRDIGKIVAEWVPDSVDQLFSNAQNEIIGLASTSSDTIYFYRTYFDGEQDILQAWFKWKVPGNVQACAIINDRVQIVTEQASQYTFCEANLNTVLSEEIIVSATGTTGNPCVDLLATATSVVNDPLDYIFVTDGGSGYSSGSPPTVTIEGNATGTAVVDSSGAVTGVTLTSVGSGYITDPDVTIAAPSSGTTATAVSTFYNGSRCYIPYNDVTSLTPIILIASQTGTQFDQSGFTLTPSTRGTDVTGTYFSVPKRDFSSVSSQVLVGYRYNYDITLPQIYYSLAADGKISDYTANLTIARMKFNMGLTGAVGFKVKSKGYDTPSYEWVGDGTTKSFYITFEVKDWNDLKVTVNGVLTTAYTFTKYPVEDQTGTGNLVFTNAPANGDKIKIYTDVWYDLQAVKNASYYLSDDEPLASEQTFTLPIHQRSSNFQVRVFSDSPFPVSLDSMMWEGNYSPRYYTRS